LLPVNRMVQVKVGSVNQATTTSIQPSLLVKIYVWCMYGTCGGRVYFDFMRE